MSTYINTMNTSTKDWKGDDWRIEPFNFQAEVLEEPCIRVEGVGNWLLEDNEVFVGKFKVGPSLEA